MPLQATSGAASYDAFGGGVPVVPNYIEEVFSSYLWTGNSTTGGTQTITNNIDLSTKGGMVWVKGRSAASNHILTDTSRGVGSSSTDNNALSSNLTTEEDLGFIDYDYLSAFNTTGFTVKQGGTTTATRGTNYNAVTYASWTFRKQPKFFDIVTYTGNGTTQNIAHNLGVSPAVVIIKKRSATSNWTVWHRSLTSGNYILLNTTAAQTTSSAVTMFGDNTTTVDPTSTQFTVGQSTQVNENASSHVAYLFAHDAGGFGLTGTDNVISCGSYTGNGTATGPDVNLGYEPQFLLVKNASAVGSWFMWDSMRGITADGSVQNLTANASTAETNSTSAMSINATGFSPRSIVFSGSGSTYIYIAIRRGPMKVPTTGTSVFSPVARAGTGATASITSAGFSPDLVAIKSRDAAYSNAWTDRLRGNGLILFTDATVIDQNYGSTSVNLTSNMGVSLSSETLVNQSGTNYINYLFRRAPSFFDEVCYTGTGVARTISHNLGVAPELIIVKARNDSTNWGVYSKPTTALRYLFLQSNAALQPDTPLSIWNDTEPTASVFSLAGSSATDYTTVNDGAGINYVAYLFATCPAVSKVGSYTGTGTTKQIDCGFTSGARFVLIKRTNSTGDWYVWDSARGIVSGNDPYLILNDNPAEVTNTDYVDTYSAGFEISSTAPAAINANGGSFIFFAVA